MRCLTISLSEVQLREYSTWYQLRIMKAVLVIISLLGVGHSLTYGPCHPVNPVEVYNERWTGSLYVNIHHNSPGARCEWVDRYLIEDGNEVFLGDTFKHIENDQVLQSTWKGKKVGKGHYTFTALVDGSNTTYHTYFLHFDPPTLTCHYACTDDPRNQHLKGQLFCEGPSPDALVENAHTIRKVAEDNGIDVGDLMVIDNCNCPNIPYLPGMESKCDHLTAQEYFCI